MNSLAGRISVVLFSLVLALPFATALFFVDSPFPYFALIGNFVFGKKETYGIISYSCAEHSPSVYPSFPFLVACYATL